MNKLFLRWIAVFGMVMMFGVSGWGDGGSNDSCNGEQIGELHGISSTTSRTETGSVSSSDGNDYYYFTPGVAGTLNIVYSATASTDFYLATSGCGDNRVVNNGTSYTNTSFAVTSSDTVYMRIKREGGTPNYSMEMIFTVATSSPEINVQGNGVTINDGDSSPATADLTDFGSTLVSGGTVTRTFTIQNTGTVALSVGSVTISGTNSSDFSVTSQPSASVAAGSSTTFSVRFDPSAMGSRTATLSFTNNDTTGSESPYDFSISGIGDGPPVMGDIPNQSVTAGSAFSLNLSTYVTLTNGDPVTGYALTGTLPAGLVFNTASGVISGTPTTAGTATLSATASDNDGTSNSDTFTITVSAVPSGTIVYTSGVSAQQLADQIQGPGLTITNPRISGQGKQFAIFNNGKSGANLEIDAGIIMATMDVDHAFTSNDSGSTSDSFSGNSTDSDLLNIDSRARYDTVVFEFDVTLGENTRLIMIDYQFAAEEYNEWVGTKFNDAFGFFIKDKAPSQDLNQTYNVARVVDDSTIVTTQNISNYDTVTVNNVNKGVPGSNASNPDYAATTPPVYSNSKYFIDNTVASHPVKVEFDGLTHRLHATLDNLTPGKTYTFKMAIADTADAQYDTGVFVNKIMGVRAPDLCYDYAYKQDGHYITNKAYVAQVPQLDALVVPGSTVETTVFIRNEEISELTAQNINVDINDINVTQATYTPGTVSVIYPGGNSKTAIADNSGGMSVDDSFIHDIPIGDLGSKEFFYINYGLTPLGSSLKMPIDARIQFDLVIQGVTVPYNFVLGSDKVPMCVDQVIYAPAYGIYNIVDPRANLGSAFDVNSTSVKNNLPTQVVNRPTVLEIVSYDADHVDRVKASNTVLAVEMIDAGGFFDVNASCSDPSNGISPRAWVQFGDIDANITHTSFSSDLLGSGLNPDVTTEDFFGRAIENGAYRISFNMDDSNGTVQLDEVTPGRYKLKNFTTYAGETCGGDIDGNPHNTDTVPAYCGNNGQGNGSGMTTDELRNCMECIHGLKTKSFCSRDNFSIRPEAFNVKIVDTNGSVSVPFDANLSAGYNYRFDINATNHIDSNASLGYVANFSAAQPSADRNATFYWAPNTHIVSGCNDTNNTSIDFYFSEGKVEDQSRSHSNVGRYQLNVRDKLWTAVDQAPAHHVGSSWISGDDCSNGSSVPLYDSANSYTDNMVGCEISSQHYKLSPAVTMYNDYNLTFRPHHFMIPFAYGLGKTAREIAALGNGFVYDSDMDSNNERNMAVRATGTIKAVGATGDSLSNFVRECYASDLNITMHNDANVTDATAKYRYKVNQVDINATNGNEIDIGVQQLDADRDFLVEAARFQKNGNGNLSTGLRFNFDRDETVLLDPQTVHYSKLDIGCLVENECTRQADGLIDGEADGSSVMNFNVMHVYGRMIPRDVRVFGTADFTANGWYEVYNTPTLNAVALQPSRNDGLWYINRLHDDTNDGDAAITVIKATTASTLPIMAVSNATGIEVYNLEGQTPPYNAKAHINVDPWLWYGVKAADYLAPNTDTNVDCLTHPCFNISVVPQIGATGSAKTGDDADRKDNKSSKSTEEAGAWKSTSDYAPAIR